MEFSEKRKLLIVDDSAFMRKIISDFFEGNSKIEVVGTARNGKDAIKKIKRLKPDVVTMDIEMPELNGLDALKEIMGKYPVPVIMLSSSTKKGAENTVIAMENGAVDFVTKPGGPISLELHKVKEQLVRKVELASQIPITKLNRNNDKTIYETTDRSIELTPVNPITKQVRKKGSVDFIRRQMNSNNWSKTANKIVLIGTSTGGPRALQEVITKLPATIEAPILIVQHMPAGFTKSLADRLNQISKIKVKEAEHGDVLKKGTAYIAPGGYHLKIKKAGPNFEVVLDKTEPPRSGHRPSVDVMFESVSDFNEFDKVAVIMTGMGYDGSKGIVKLKENGNVIAIAESQETCIVYGMPKAAVETQLVDEVVDVDEIAETIMKYFP